MVKGTEKSGKQRIGAWGAKTTFKFVKSPICCGCPGELSLSSLSQLVQWCSNGGEVLDKPAVIRRHTNEPTDVTKAGRSWKVTHGLNFGRIWRGTALGYNVTKEFD